MIGGFYLAGLLLAFTPCVLPMVPILSGIIAGGGARVTTGRAFALSVTYVLGMALTYTAAGIAGAAMGREVQALFQQWWVLAMFAAVFVAMALSMFGLYTVQMPAAIQTRIANLSNRQSTGTFGGVAIMGALSALIVTTCVGPALVAALLVIGQTGQIARGGAALFAMSIGMGTPLLIVGASAGKLLPRAGAWMDFVKKLFGVMMLGVAAWMLARIVTDRAALLLWAVPALTLAWLLWFELKARSAARWALRVAGLAVGLYGVALAAGSALGGSDPLSPIPALAREQRELPFRAVHTVTDLEREVRGASAAKRGVMLDFSADWCTSCKEMERDTFTDPGVQSTLANVTLLRADVTADNADDQRAPQTLRNLRPSDDRLLRSGRPGAERVSRGRVPEGRCLRDPGARGASVPAVSPARSAAAVLAVAGILAGFGTAGFLLARHLGPERTVLQPAALHPAPAPPTEAGPKPGPIPERPPDFSLPDLAGVPHTLSDWRGRPLAVNFWATWCEPCRREIPLLEDLRRESAQNGFEIVGIAVDNRDSIVKFVRDMKVNYTVLVGEQGGRKPRRNSAWSRCSRSRCLPTPRIGSLRSRSASCIGTRRRSSSRAWHSGRAG